MCCIQDLKKWCNLRDIKLIAARSGSWRPSCSRWSPRHRSSSASSSARRSLCIARSERARSETCAQAAWAPSDGRARSCHRLLSSPHCMRRSMRRVHSASLITERRWQPRAPTLPRRQISVLHFVSGKDRRRLLRTSCRKWRSPSTWTGPTPALNLTAWRARTLEGTLLLHGRRRTVEDCACTAHPVGRQSPRQGGTPVTTAAIVEEEI